MNRLIMYVSILRLIVSLVVFKSVEGSMSGLSNPHHHKMFGQKGNTANVDIQETNQRKKYDLNKLLSVKSMLADPHLEEFRFIYRGTTQSNDATSKEIPARNIAIIKYPLNGHNARKTFKVKIKMPQGIMKQRKLKGMVIYPKRSRNTNSDCQWTFGTIAHSLMVVVPEGCIKLIPQLVKNHLRREQISAILMPRQKRIQSKLIRQILKGFTVVRYGRRMGSCLKMISVKGKIAKLVLPRRQWRRTFRTRA